MKRFLLLALAVVMLMPLAHGLTAALGNARADISVNASPENPATIDRKILLQNKNDIPVIVTIAPDSKYAGWIDLPQSKVELQPAESKSVPYTVTIDRGGTHEIRFAVGFSAADPELKENNVGLSATLIVVSSGPSIPFPEDELINGTKDSDVIVGSKIPVNSGSNSGNDTFPDDTGAGMTISPGKNPGKIPADILADNTGTSADGASSGKPGRSPVIGILIIVLVNVIGLALIVTVIRMMRKK